ncbi:MAG: twin-arginine translocase subunit TatC [Bacteroidales bacterium]|nr:twin-arginine translocase subunit TatC [Bacteroidales bacterium]
MANRSRDRQGERLAEMGFWDHVDALRSVLLRAGGVVLVLTIAFFIAMPWIFDNVILAPCHGDFPLYRLFARISGEGGGGLLPSFADGGDFHVELINIQLASQFFIHMSTSFWLAIVFAFPIIIYLLWGFVAPGLYSGERRGIKKAFVAGNMMFFVGVAVGYFLVFPLTLRFLAEYKVSEMVPNQISLDSYMDNFLVLILVMGLIFELPLVAWLLGNMGLLTRRLFTTYRRHAVAALLILAAVITPTGDPFTLMVVFLPIYGLWELSAFLVPRYSEEEEEEATGPVDPLRVVDTSRTLDDLYIPTYRSSRSSSADGGGQQSGQ